MDPYIEEWASRRDKIRRKSFAILDPGTIAGKSLPA